MVTKQVYRSAIKNQELFDQLFIILINNKKGKKSNKVLVVDSTDLCTAFMTYYQGRMDMRTEFSLTEACRNYVGKYSMTVLVND